MIHEIDDIDKRILNLLQEDATLPLKNIAEKVHASVATCQRRIQMMTEQEVKQLLIDTQAILEGHFLLTSGLHSPMYVEKFNVLQHPKYTETLCKELAERFRDQNVELVIGPMTGGIFHSSCAVFPCTLDFSFPWFLPE